MSFKVFTHILKNALIKRKRDDVILPNYPSQLLVCFSLKKNNSLEVVYIVLIEEYN